MIAFVCEMILCETISFSDARLSALASGSLFTSSTLERGGYLEGELGQF